MTIIVTTHYFPDGKGVESTHGADGSVKIRHLPIDPARAHTQTEPERPHILERRGFRWIPGVA